MVDYFLLALSIILIIVGLIGCVVPVLPGPPISFLGLLIIEYTKWGPIDSDILWSFGFVALTVSVLDYIVPIWGTKKLGGSKYGLWGASIGIIVGLFFGPVGIIIGPFLGAFIGELSQKTDGTKALKAAFGSIIGFLMGIGLKLIASGIITWYYLKVIF